MQTSTVCGNGALEKILFLLLINSGEKHLLRKCPAPLVLAVKIGYPVVLLKNLSRDFVNGMTGIVSEITDGRPVINFGKKLLHLEKQIFPVYKCKVWHSTGREDSFLLSWLMQ